MSDATSLDHSVRNGQFPPQDPHKGEGHDDPPSRPTPAQPSSPTLWMSIMEFFGFGGTTDGELWQIPRPDAKAKAQLLYNYCIASDRRVSESVHSLYAIAEHYGSENPAELERPETINGIPPFFKSMSNREKSTYCYNLVTESLSSEAKPVTIESLLATRRLIPSDPTSSFAGRFVRRVTQYVIGTLLVIGAAYGLLWIWASFLSGPWLPAEGIFMGDVAFMKYPTWVAFGCIGALVHLLNTALTTTRLQTFEISEERKVGPRLLLGGMLGFILPWLVDQGLSLSEGFAVGTVAAFFAGYSVRFVISLLERVLSALMPETEVKK